MLETSSVSSQQGAPDVAGDTAHGPGEDDAPYQAHPRKPPIECFIARGIGERLGLSARDLGDLHGGLPRTP